MEKEGKLSKIASSFKSNLKSKLLIPALAAFMFAGCYTSFKTIEVEVSQPRNKTYLFRDTDRDGIPDIYDAHPYFYDRSPNGFMWFKIYHQDFPVYNKNLRPWERYSSPKNNWKPKPKYNFPRDNRDAGKIKLRNNDGSRERNNQKSPPPRNNSQDNQKKRIR